MKSPQGILRRAAAILLLALSAAPLWAAQDPKPNPKLALRPESRLWLEGDSTLHAYSSTATKVSVEGEIEGPATLKRTLIGLAREKGLKGLAFRIPVQGLKSGKAGLDKNMRRALKADEFPEIVLRLEAYILAPQVAGAGIFQVRAAGRLEVAGKESTLELEAQASAADGRLRVRGVRELLMTDFGIKPPTMLLGALKTEDRVVVHYDLVLGLDEEPGMETRREP